MKTFIIQLEQHDDIISAQDKMSWAKSGRILLVWPKHGHLLNRRLDLTLLQRYSTSLGAPLAVVSHDSDVRYYGPRMGIPVYASLRKAQNTHWRVPRRFRRLQDEVGVATNWEAKIATIKEMRPHKAHPLAKPEIKPKRISGLTRFVFFTLGVLALLSIAAILFPSAQVTLIPQIQVQETTIEARAIPESTAVNISGAIPARYKNITVEGRESIPVTGSIILPDQPATGFVKFTNLTDQSIEIPIGTVVRTLGNSSEGEPSIKFSVSEAGVVPVGPGNFITLPVHCLTPGIQGNLPANSLVAIEGIMGTQLSVINPDPTLNGSERKELAPTEEDRQKLTEKLQKSLEQTALKEIEKGFSDGDLLIPSSLELLNKIEETFQPTGLQPADKLSLSQRLEFRVLYVSNEDLQKLAQAVLDTNLPELFVPLEGTMQIDNLGDLTIAPDTTAHWKLHTSRKIQVRFTEPQIVQLILGKEPWKAKAQLETVLPLRESPQISLFPTWWPRLPFVPFRIKVNVL